MEGSHGTHSHPPNWGRYGRGNATQTRSFLATKACAPERRVCEGPFFDVPNLCPLSARCAGCRPSLSWGFLLPHHRVSRFRRLPRSATAPTQNCLDLRLARPLPRLRLAKPRSSISGSPARTCGDGDAPPLAPRRRWSATRRAEGCAKWKTGLNCKLSSIVSNSELAPVYVSPTACGPLTSSLIRPFFCLTLNTAHAYSTAQLAGGAVAQAPSSRGAE